MKFFLLDAADGAAKIITIVSIAALCLLGIIFLALILSKSIRDTRSIVFGAICIALSFGLSYIKFSFPYGGSITLASFVPLLIYSYVFGIQRGLFAGVIHGLLQILQELYFLTPMQFALDYILAFASIALAGAFKKISGFKTSVILGALAVGIARYLMHVFAGITFFYAGWIVEGPPTDSAFIYSAVYNLYVLADIAIATAVLIFLLLGGYYRRLINIVKR